MERADLWAMFYASALIAEREKPEEKADLMLKEFDQRWQSRTTTRDMYDPRKEPPAKR